MSSDLPPEGARDARGTARSLMKFPEGDTRRAPFSVTEQAEAAEMLESEDRWHVRNAADMLAVRLQYGRGLSIAKTARMFGIGATFIGKRIHNEKWKPAMSERDRRELARLIWLGGLMRGARESEQSLSALRAASEWRMAAGATGRRWQPKDGNGQPKSMTVHEEISDDAYYTDADPNREEREAMRAKLQAVLDEIEDEAREESEDEAGNESEAGNENDESADAEAEDAEADGDASAAAVGDEGGGGPE